MNATALSQFKQALEDLKTDLKSLRENAVSISTAVDRNCLPSDSMSMQLEAALKEYRTKAARLQELGVAISITVCDSMEQLDAGVAAAEAQLELDLKRGVIMDFFRLTAEAENIRKALETAKRLLMGKCRLPAADREEALAPYRLVIQQIKNGTASLPDEEYEYLENTIGRPIARALDRGELSINPSLDVSAYLDGSCAVLSPAEKVPSASETKSEETTNVASDDAAGSGGQPAEKRNETPAPVEEDADAPQESAVVPIEAPATPESAETEDDGGAARLWEHFDGYVGDASVEFTDVSASELGAKNYINTAKQKPNVPINLFLIGHQKLIEKDDTPYDSNDYSAPSFEIRGYLSAHGYLMDVVIQKSGQSRTAQMLTSKAWACYTKSDVVKYLSGLKVPLIVPPALRIKNGNLTPLNAIRYLVIHDYYTAHFVKSNYMIVSATNAAPLYAKPLSGNGDDEFIVPAVFEEGNEKPDLELLCRMIQGLGENRMTIIAFSMDDIRLLDAALALGPEEKEKVHYCLCGHPKTLYDGSGTVISEVTEELPVEDEHIAVTDESPLADGMVEQESEQQKKYEDKSNSSEEAAKSSDREEKPEPDAAVLPEVDSAIRPITSVEDEKNCMNIYSEMLASGKLYCATAYLKALAEKEQRYQALSRQLAYAVNDPLYRCSYSSGRIFEVFYESDTAANDYYTVAAIIRNYFYDQCSYDYDVSRLQATTNGMPLLSFHPSLNQLVYTLSKFKVDHNKGMDIYADYRMQAYTNLEEKVCALKKDAKELYARLIEEKTKETASFKRLIETKKIIFDKEAVLAHCLKFVIDDKRSESGFIRDVLSESYIENGMPISAENVDPKKIRKEIEEAWSKAEKNLTLKKNSADLMGVRYNNLFQNIKRIASLLCDYVSEIGDNEIDAGDKAFVAYKRIKQSLLNDIADAMERLNSDIAAERSILIATLQELSGKISGTYETDAHRYFYLPFLRNKYVLLDDSYLPLLEPVKLLDALSPESRIVKHYRRAEVSYEQRLRDVFDGDDDYGSAELILRWAKQRKDDVLETAAYEEDFEAASLQPLEDVDNRYRSFVADLEMAQSQGQIDNTSGNYKDEILETADLWRAILEESRNYGFFYQILDEFRNQIRVNARIRAQDMNASLNAYMEKNAKWKADEETSAVIKTIRARIANQNYTSAEDLLNRLIAGDVSASFEGQPDYLAEFLNEYNMNNSQVGNAQKSVLQLMRIRGANKDAKGAGRLIESWPAGSGVSKEKIVGLFTLLGFDVDSDEVKKLDTINRQDHFLVKLKRPENGRKTNYKHPVYVFGSEAEKEGFRVVCIFGKMDADRLTETFKDIGNAKNTVILLDYALTLPDRRKLARKSKAEYNGKTFAVIDRIVLAYLARHYSATDINRRLMAVTMPYSAMQPYVADSSKVMPAEMFMGRETELAKIESAEGVNIVYGGRQLGKSALLRMAQKDINWDENGDRAILVDIKGKNYREAAKKVSEALSDEKFFREEYITDDWGSLARAIKNRLRSEKDAIPYFLLLMDEADAFIDSCGQVGYAPFDDLKDIQSLGTGRFKFVVAGLRNVVRFNRDKALSNNSVLTHLSALTVRPFKYTEARELIEVPLSYLGFRFPNDEKTDSLLSNICGTTNYFPGLIQLYCTKLIEAMRQDYAGYPETNTPPYFVREDHIKRALSDKTLISQIKEKFDITLKVGDDDYYYMIALIGAYLYHRSGKNSFSSDDILSVASDYCISKIERYDTSAVDALMHEMCELNVLQDTGDRRYRFARYNFYQMMGTLGDIEEEILKYGVAEG